MGIFERKKAPGKALSLQTYRKNTHPFQAISGYSPNVYEYKIFRELREAVPVIDAAIKKIVSLTGGFSIKCDDKKAEAGLKHFLEYVQVGACGRGIYSFISTYLDQLITYGTAVGEIVLNSNSYDIAALYNASLNDIELKLMENGLDVLICQKDGLEARAVKHPELILLSVFNPKAGHVYGESILKGLPFVASILLNIYKTIGINWERLGNVRFAVTYHPQGDHLDKSSAKERAVQIANEWSSTMNSPNGQVRDFVAVGDVGIKAIGSDIQILDSEIPGRQMLEQIIAKTGLPPFLLGINWSTTERMSAQQTDILTSELEHYRRILTPTILKICNTWQRLNGYYGKVRVEWNVINLQDAVEEAKARLYNAQAEKLEKEIKVIGEGGNH